jgi:hypothetical protein
MLRKKYLVSVAIAGLVACSSSKNGGVALQSPSIGVEASLPEGKEALAISKANSAVLFANLQTGDLKRDLGVDDVKFNEDGSITITGDNGLFNTGKFYKAGNFVAAESITGRETKYCYDNTYCSNTETLEDYKNLLRQKFYGDANPNVDTIDYSKIQTVKEADQNYVVATKLAFNDTPLTYTNFGYSSQVVYDKENPKNNREEEYEGFAYGIGANKVTNISSIADKDVDLKFTGKAVAGVRSNLADGEKLINGVAQLDVKKASNQDADVILALDFSGDKYYKLTVDGSNAVAIDGTNGLGGAYALKDGSFNGSSEINYYSAKGNDATKNSEIAEASGTFGFNSSNVVIEGAFAVKK